MSHTKTNKITVTAMLGAVASVLMFLEFPVPFLIPPFVEMDFSELPALLATFSLGPISGVAVCLIKNLIHALNSSTNFVGEVCNFLLGCCLVIPAGIIYKQNKTRKTALIATIIGTLSMTVFSIPINYFISYPFFTSLMPLDQIIAAYQSLLPSVDGLLTCLIVFNAPFTMLKGALDAVLAFLIYKSLSPMLHR